MSLFAASAWANETASSADAIASSSISSVDSSAIDLTRSPNKESKKAKRSHKEHKHHKSSRSRSREKKSKSKKHSKEKKSHRSKEEKQARKRQKVESLLASNASKRRDRSPGSSSDAESDVAILRPRLISTSTTATGDAMEIGSQSDREENDAEELAEALRAQAESQRLAEEEADRKKILAIEARLADPRTRTSYLHPTSIGTSTQEQVSASFVIDVKGDINNRLFQSIYRMDIPLFHTAGNSRWMVGATSCGLNTDDVHTLLRRRGPGEPILLRNPSAEDRLARRRERYFAQQWLGLERDRVTRRIRPIRRAATEAKSTDDEFRNGSEFISLSAAATSTSSIAAQLDPSLEGISFDESCSMLTRAYAIALRENPREISLWLAYALEQSSLLHPSHTILSGYNLWEKQCLILLKGLEANPGAFQLQFALLQRAIHVWKKREQIQQLFEQLFATHTHEGTVWNTYIDWMSGALTSPTSGEVVEFRVDDVLYAYRKAFTSLEGVREKIHAQSHSSISNASAMFQRAHELAKKMDRVNRTMQGLFFKLMRFLHQIGQEERALAMWQVQIEWNLFRRREGKYSDPALAKQFLSHFFDCDCARFGEEGSVGFSRWISLMEIGRPPFVRCDCMEVNGPEPIDHALPIHGWIHLERTLTQEQFLPAGSVPPHAPFESASSTLDRVVLWEDIEIGIFDLAGVREERDRTPMVEMQSSLLIHETILTGLGQIFQLPASWFVLPGGMVLNGLAVEHHGANEIRSCSSIDRSADFTTSEFFEFIPFICGTGCTDPFLGPIVSSPTVEKDDVTLPGTGDAKPVDPHTMLQTASSIEAAERAILCSTAKVAFIRRSLTQLRDSTPASTIGRVATLCFEYSLADAERRLADVDQERFYPFSAAQGHVREFLKQDPTNLLLLHAYATLEFRYGFVESACVIFERTLQSQAASQLGPQAPILFWTHAQMLISRAYPAPRDSDESTTLIRQAVHAILCASEGSFTPFDPTVPLRPLRILQAKKRLQSSIDSGTWTLPQDLSGLSISPPTCWTALSLWLEYLTSGLAGAQKLWRSAIDAALKRQKDGLVHGSTQHEWITTVYVRLLTAHRSLHTYSPRLFRMEIESALEIFPQNGFCLSLLRESYSGLPSGLLRRWFDDALSGDSSVRDLPPIDACNVDTPAGMESLLQRARLLQRHRPSGSPLLTLHAISSELDRPGGGHRIETLFERALQPTVDVPSSFSSSSLLLWRMYLRYQAVKGRLGAASKLLYRAVQSVPFSKGLWIDAVEWITEAQAAQSIRVPAETQRDPDILTTQQVYEFFHSQVGRSLRHRVVLVPEREGEITERPWERYARQERERHEDRKRRRRESRERRRERSQERHRKRSRERRKRRKRRRSNSSSRSPSHSDDSGTRRRRASRSRTPSPSRSPSRSQLHHRSRRHRSRSTSRSTSRSGSTSSPSRARSVSSSLERFRQRYRAPLPVRPRSTSKSRSRSRERGKRD